MDVLRHGDEGRRHLILEACRIESVGEYICDDRHDWYLAELLQATGRTDDYLRELAEREPRTLATRKQWAGMLCELGIRGNLHAKRLIAERWAFDLQRGNCFLAAAHVRIEGANAYREVLACIATNWRHRRKIVERAWYIHNEAEEHFGEKEAEEMREGFDKRLARVADFPRKRSDRSLYKPSPRPSAMERLLAGRPVSGRSLKPEEISGIADLLNTDLEEKVLPRVLDVFHNVPFPGDIRILIKWYEHEDPDYCRAALGALALLKAPGVRELAFKHADDPSTRSEAISVLRVHFKPGDEAWVLQQLSRDLVSDWHHHEIIATIEVIEAHPSGHWEDALAYIVGNSHCQICRNTAAKNLHSRGKLTHHEIKVLRLDAAEHTRHWASELRLDNR